MLRKLTHVLTVRNCRYSNFPTSQRNY